MKNVDVNKTKGPKRVLKPVIEKKRRDRINQNLNELRMLLLRCTKDTRLQNPKLEKAEILDLAVQYLRRDSEKRAKINGSVNHHSPNKDVSPEIPMSGLQTSTAQQSSLYTAGFHQCLSDVSSFVSNTCSPKVDSEVNKLKVCLDGHFTSSGRQGHGTEGQFPTNDAATGGLPDAPPVSGHLTPPHSPVLNRSSPASPLSPHSNASSSCDPSFSHKTALYSFDTRHQLSPSSSSSFSFASRLAAFQSPSTAGRRAVPSNPASSTWRPWS